MHSPPPPPPLRALTAGEARGAARRRRWRVECLHCIRGLYSHSGVGRADEQLGEGAVAQVNVGAPAILLARRQEAEAGANMSARSSGWV